MKTKIFTTNSIHRLHPRIQMQVNILQKNNIFVEIVRTTTRKDGYPWELINLLMFKYFRWGTITKFKKQLEGCDVVHIYDLALLPLAKYAKKKGKKVIYETLDDNVHLTFDFWETQLPFLRIIKRPIVSFYSNLEKRLSAKYCDKIIVNSHNLLEYFPSEKSNLIFYASGMEELSTESFSSLKENRFIYLGKLNKGKGVEYYEEIIKKHNVKMLFYGEAHDELTLKIIERNKDLIENLGVYPTEELFQKLKIDIQKYNLIGLSIIIPKNKSYMFQEANKDIDYMAMKMPFIGNYRIPTKEKIDLGAGVFFDNESLIQDLLSNKNGCYDAIRQTDELLYAKYSTSNFEKQLINIYLN